MYRNIDSKFSKAPLTLDMQRSRFDRSQDHKTTFNAGDLVPIFVDEVLPGDTFDLSTAYTCRMSTPVFPVMDNAYLETAFFFVPNRLIWDHWKEMCGENNSSYWTQTTEYTVPQIKFPVVYDEEGNHIGFTKGSVADYMGVPTYINSTGLSEDEDLSTISALPFRAYVKIWNDWWRDQNVMQPAWLPTDDTDRHGLPSVPYLDDGIHEPDPRTDAVLGGALLKVSKYHDYFTSALPAPQKGPAVSVGSTAPLPVVTGDVNRNLGITTPLLFEGLDGAFTEDNSNYGFPLGVYTDTPDGFNYYGESRINTTSANGFSDGFPVAPINLQALQTSGIAVNDIRIAFQLQKIYENDARGGTRYIELLKAHFGVDSPDARLQRSEYLGGSRQPININQVIQTSSTNEVSPIGTASAYSLTNGRDSSFVKSFTEHGWIIGVACVRTDHTYQQGINRMWSRKRRFDFYWPALANIGEQAILRKELVMTGTIQDDDAAFGYQEAWADYRYKPSIVTGAFRSNVPGSLDVWHYADDFEEDQVASMVVDEAFITETKANIDRTLAVTSDLEDQFICDFYFQNLVTRVMPLYSVPGLVDHH